MNNKLSTIGAFILLLAAVATSCKKQEGVEAPERITTLEVVSGDGSQTKTWMGEASEGVIPVYWSNGDKVSINGVTSSEITVAPGEKLSKVSFTARNVSAPYSVIYPAEDCAEYDFQTGLYSIVIPSVQEYVPGSFSCGSAVLYGTSDDEDTPVVLKNLCGAVKVTLKDESAIIKSLVLTSLGGEPITGKYTLDVKDGVLTPVEGGNVVTVTLPEEGVALTSSGTSFIITIPAGDYPQGFSLRFEDSTKHILRNYWLRASSGAEAGVTVASGQIVVFEAQAYDPDAREITSAEDWEEFAAAYNSGSWESDWLGKDGTIKISEDFQAGKLTRLNNFAGVLDGQGHTVTQTAATLPIVNTLTGTVRNLTLAGNMTPSDPSTSGATAFVSILSAGGLIDNCVNEMAITLNNAKKTVAGALVRSMKGGQLKNSVNKGEIKLSVDLSSDQIVIAGGLVGTVAELSEQALISGCSNEAPLTVTLVKSAAGGTRTLHSGYGGIVGTVADGGDTKFLTVENSDNTADVKVTYSVSPTSAGGQSTGAGGIVGAILKYRSDGPTMWWWSRQPAAGSLTSIDGYYAVLRNCSNSGNISNDIVSTCSSDDPYKGFTGGVIGVANGMAANHILIDGCSNYGKVIGHEFTYSRSALGAAAGGLIGMGAYVDAVNCIVKSTQVGSAKRQNYSTSGLLGYAVGAFKLQGCKVFVDLVHIRTTNYTDKNHSLGFTLSTKDAGQGGLYPEFRKIDGSEVTGCAFGGTIKYNTAIVAYNAGSFKLDKTETITASNFGNYVASESFFVDADKKGWPSKVKIENNTYWDGKE